MIVKSAFKKITRDKIDITISSVDKWLDNMTPVKIGRKMMMKI